MLDNVVEPIPYLQAVKTNSDQFKKQTGKNLAYEQYSEQFIPAVTTHDKNI